MKHTIMLGILALGGSTACQAALDLDQFSFADPPQGVVWLGLGAAQGQSCAWPRSYQLPDQARETITSSSGQGARIVDDDRAVVTCRVSSIAGANAVYDVSLAVSSGDVASFLATGRLSAAGATMRVAIETAQFSLEANDCTAAVRAAAPGAFWIQNLTCPDLRDSNQPGISCTGVGGLIFERCSR